MNRHSNGELEAIRALRAQAALGLDGTGDRRLGCWKHGKDTITSSLHNPATGVDDHLLEQSVMALHEGSHRLRIAVPTTSRTDHVGEQNPKGHRQRFHRDLRKTYGLMPEVRSGDVPLCTGPSRGSSDMTVSLRRQDALVDRPISALNMGGS